jgi:glucuronate isomerase
MSDSNSDSGPKFRKLTELKPSTAQEYQEAMVKRVDHFAKTGTSTFNNALENVIVSGAGLFLNIKEKVDALLGDDLTDKVHDAFSKFLLLF